MATVFTDDTITYEGPVATKWYSAMILGGTTMTRLLDAQSVMPDVKSKAQIPSIHIGDSTTAYNCDWSPSGTYAIATKSIEVADLAVQKEICEKDMNPLFISALMRSGSNNEDFVPPAVMDVILQQQVRVVNKEVEFMIWRGDTGGAVGNYLDRIDGFLVKFLADATVIDVIGVATTAANIQGELDRIKAVIPDVMRSTYDEPTVGFWMSPGNVDKYRSSLVNAFNNPDKIQPELSYVGIKIFPTTGLTDSDIVFADARNLWVACDVIGEEKEITLIPQKKISGAPKVHLNAPYKLGVNHLVGAEIVWWHKP